MEPIEDTMRGSKAARLEGAVRLWLGAERGGASARDAERTLRAVFLRLPLASPSATFAASVLGAVRRRSDPFARRGLRALIAAAGVLLAVGAALLPGSLALLRATLGEGFGPGELLALVVQGILGLCSSLVRALSVWEALGDLSAAGAAMAASTPGKLLLLFAVLLTSAAAWSLRGLLSFDREVVR